MSAIPKFCRIHSLTPGEYPGKSLETGRCFMCWLDFLHNAPDDTTFSLKELGMVLACLATEIKEDLVNQIRASDARTAAVQTAMDKKTAASMEALKEKIAEKYEREIKMSPSKSPMSTDEKFYKEFKEKFDKEYIKDYKSKVVLRRCRHCGAEHFTNLNYCMTCSRSY